MTRRGKLSIEEFGILFDLYMRAWDDDSFGSYGPHSGETQEKADRDALGILPDSLVEGLYAAAEDRAAVRAVIVSLIEHGHIAARGGRYFVRDLPRWPKNARRSWRAARDIMRRMWPPETRGDA